MPIILEPTNTLSSPTALDLITASAKRLGVIGQGESLGAQEAQDGLDGLNSMIDGLATEKLLLPHMTTDILTWPANTASQTIGVGANLNTTWPLRLESGTFFRYNNIDYPVQVTEDPQVYDRIRFKAVAGAWPDLIYFDRAYPVGTLSIYPYPKLTMELHLLSWKPLQVFYSLTTKLSLPPGYRWMLEHKLAVTMESIWGMPCPDSVRMEAVTSQARLKRLNAVPQTSDLTEASLVVDSRNGRSASRPSILSGG